MDIKKGDRLLFSTEILDWLDDREEHFTESFILEAAGSPEFGEVECIVPDGTGHEGSSTDRLSENRWYYPVEFIERVLRNPLSDVKKIL